MKGKVYVFGIGGTGSRVIKSLVMLAAAGVEMDTDAIVPIIVDPDFANADVTRTIEFVKTYESIRGKLAYNDATKNRFFRTSISSIVDGCRLMLKDTKNKKFREFIQYGTLSKENMALASMLFSEQNMESDMEVGFKGNPNMGSVVLNQIADSKDFEDFAAAFNPGDRIFIISSIFGGTGASGFPLLLKNIRGLKSEMPNSNAIKTAPVGAVTVLPYFDIKPDEESSINSSSFIGKTKAALQYYEKNVNGDKSSINLLYYVGDVRSMQYENNEGGPEQRNNAHFVELAAALSIVDFVSIPDDDACLVCEQDEVDNHKVFAPNARFREFGIENDAREILFGNLSSVTRGILSAPMTRLVLFSRYLRERLSKSLSCTWAVDNNIDDAFLKTAFVTDIRKFADSYIEWLNEMANNDRGFKPYNLDTDKSGLFSLVNGVTPASIKALWAFGKSGYDLFDAAMNREYISMPKNYTREQKFVELFYLVTKKLVDNKYKF